jgi:hypothetical protein
MILDIVRLLQTCEEFCYARRTDLLYQPDVPADKRAMAGYGAFAQMMDVAEQAVTSSDYIAGDWSEPLELDIGPHRHHCASA